MGGRRDPGELRERLHYLLGSRVAALEPLHGGMVAAVRLAALEDGRRVVLKSSRETSLRVEAAMLRYLAERTSLPVPEVLFADDDLLVLERLPGSVGASGAAEGHAGELLAALHTTVPSPGDLEGVGGEGLVQRTAGGAIPSGRAPFAGRAGKGAPYGFPFDTLIGSLPQDNGWAGDWPTFYRERRLVPVVRRCREAGSLPEELTVRLERLLEDLPDLLDHRPAPSLLHGDVWSGNILAAGGRVTGLLDPALYYGDREVELAFIDLFATFGRTFHRTYEDLLPVGEGYRELRRDIYQLYPLLVHVALFGGGYLDGVRGRLERLGY